MAQSLEDELGWDRPLRKRRGSPKRLEGIDLYYDFKWYDVFPDGRAQFKNGLCLARLVQGDCPEGKTPALLLTKRDVEERVVETDARFVVVLNFPRYLSQAAPNAALSYYATALGPGITGASRLHEVAAQPDVIEAVVTRELDVKHIAAWVKAKKGRLDQLRRIAGLNDAGATKKADPSSVIAALEKMEDVDAEILDAIERLLGQDMDREDRLRLLRALTNDREGRDATGEVLVERITDRLADARAVTKEYRSLLKKAGETAMQQFIEENPWLLGLDYVKVRPRRMLPRGTMDFILERYDGFHDLLELKNPQDPIVVAPDEVDGLPPPASDFALSPDLAQALAQVHVYRDVLSTDAETVRTRYGLPNTRDPRVIIVIGQGHSLQPHRADVLRELNLSLHRMEVVPYDVLADRATTLLDNVEHYLAAAPIEPPAV